jgi:hypothetical protein
MLEKLIRKYKRKYDVAVDIEENEDELIPNIYKEIIADLENLINL